MLVLQPIYEYPRYRVNTLSRTVTRVYTLLKEIKLKNLKVLLSPVQL